MTIDIPDEIINSTNKCRHYFECLVDGKCSCCSPVRMVGNNCLFVNNGDNHTECLYGIHYGYDSYICSCPTRIEIFKRYERR